VHRLLREDESVRQQLVDRLGEGILAGGRIDRAAVAEIVFADRGELEWLEALLHPVVVSEYLLWRERLAALPDPPALAVTEVPLLYEVGGDSRFEAVVVITAAPEVRISRRVRPMQDRERRLIPDREKVARADFAYVNDGSFEELDAFVSGVVTRLSE
jgi:dephospho-CoA kinase